MVRVTVVLIALSLATPAFAQVTTHGAQHRWDRNGNFLGTEAPQGADGKWCSRNAKGALDMLNCSEKQRTGQGINRRYLEMAPVGPYAGQGSGSSGPACPGTSGPQRDSCLRGDSSNIWQQQPRYYGQ